MSEELIGYKVVRRHTNKDFMSATMLGRLTIYTIGKKTLRPTGCGPLAVFDTLHNVKLFINYSCTRPLYMRTLKVKYSASINTNFWRIVDGEIERPLFPLPAGTIFADSVTPIEVVE